MPNFSKLLCVIDPTSDTQPALQRAAWIAGHSGAKLELFVCYYNQYLRGDQFLDSSSFQRTRDEALDIQRVRLEKMAQPLRENGLDVCVSAVWEHPMYDAVARHATAVNANVVFKDTHHHPASMRGLFSNTDWNLIRTCPVPLWLVKPAKITDKPVFLAAIDPTHEHDKPAALDEAILSISKALAKLSNAEVHAFHSFDPNLASPVAAANAYGPVLLDVEGIGETIRVEHKKRFAAITKSHELDAERSHFVSGFTHEELPALAKKLNASVVVMGAVARNRLKRIFIGATAERTLEELPCDLLIVKPDWYYAPKEADEVDSDQR